MSKEKRHQVKRDFLAGSDQTGKHVADSWAEAYGGSHENNGFLTHFFQLYIDRGMKQGKIEIAGRIESGDTGKALP